MSVQHDSSAVSTTPDGCPVSSVTHSPTGCPVSSLAASFDPFRGAYQVNPGDSLKLARKEEPVFYSPVLDYWVVTRYNDIKEIFKNPELFSAAITLEQITPVSEEAIEILDGYDFALDRPSSTRTSPSIPSGDVR